LVPAMFPIATPVKVDQISSYAEKNDSQTSTQTNWTETQKLLPSDGAEEDFFGQSVSLDGDTALIGAYFDDGGQGSAYVYTNTGTTWTQQAKLVASDGEAGDWFGYSVSLQGDTALIGAYMDDDTAEHCGSAYVFVRSDTTWTQQSKLLAADGAYLDAFGAGVSLSEDTALIGTPGDDDNGLNSGSAYVFTRSGTIWTQQAKLLASDGATEDTLGWSVSADGDTALIGAGADDDNGADSGSAYVFTRTGITWTQQQKLLASDGAAGDYFSSSLALDTDMALIGASSDDDNGNWSGSAYTFLRVGTTWTQQQKLQPSDNAEGDSFGSAVSLDDTTALIGAFNDDYTGSAYVFVYAGSTWTQQAKLVSSDGAIGDWFGNSVAVNEDTALVGAPSDDDNGWESGSSYMFEKTSLNQPPSPPDIDGPTTVKAMISYQWNFTSVDPDNDDVFYQINWGDNVISNWSGPYTSGEPDPESHVYQIKGTYTIKARAKDASGAVSDWTPFGIRVPLLFEQPHFRFLYWLCEQFPNAFPVLRYLIGY